MCVASLLAATPAAAKGPAEPRLYHPVTIGESGDVDPTSLRQALDAVAQRVGDRPAEVVLLVHGYNTSEKWGRIQYQSIARTLREERKGAGAAVEVVGVHWASHPGNGWEWIPRVVGYRFLSELGFRKAVRNPYWEKVLQARRTGRQGLRSLAFALQDRLPQARLHAWAHSMGSEVVLRALAPEAERDQPAITEPRRQLNLGLVCMAGADLDEDVFSSAKDPTARLALDRAALWWFTVPRTHLADVVLELRRGAGRRDAIGNLGLELQRPDLDRLLTRRGLVIDQEAPISHAIEAYYSGLRVNSLLHAMAYLRDPASPEARSSVPAALEPYDGPSPAVRYSPIALPSLRLYSRWREEPEARSYGLVRVAEPKAKQASRFGRSRGPLAAH